MSIMDEVRDHLLADANLAALIGTRVYPLLLPQAPTLPAITFQIISAQRENIWEGALGLVRSRVQFDVWAATYAVVDDTFHKLRERLDGYRSPPGSSPFKGAYIGSERDLHEPDVKLFRKSVDFFIWHTEET